MLYRTVKALASAIIPVLFKMEVSGREKVPPFGPLVVCSNHIAWLDPVVLAAVFPFRLRFMAKEELFSNPLFTWALGRLGAFPVRRGTADRTAIQRAGDVLASGGVIGMFPEGTRSKTGEIGKGHNGAAYLAVRSGAPILPVGISGPYRLNRTLRVAIGNPIAFERAGKRVSSKDMEGAGGVVMEALAGLVERGSGVADQGR